MTTKQKYKPNHLQSRLPHHSALPITGKTDKQKLSINLTLYEPYTKHWTNLRRVETKRKKEFNLEDWEKETSNTVSLKKRKKERKRKGRKILNK